MTKSVDVLDNKSLNTSVVIPVLWANFLDEIARRRGVSRGELIRDAIAVALFSPRTATGVIEERSSHVPTSPIGL